MTRRTKNNWEEFKKDCEGYFFDPGTMDTDNFRMEIVWEWIEKKLSKAYKQGLKNGKEEVNQIIKNIRHNGDCQKMGCYMTFNEAVDDILNELNTAEQRGY